MAKYIKEDDKFDSEAEEDKETFLESLCAYFTKLIFQSVSIEMD